MKLPLERGNIPATKPPLPPLLKRGKNALAGELVHRVRAQIQEPCNLLAVKKNVVFFDHPSIPAIDNARVMTRLATAPSPIIINTAVKIGQEMIFPVDP